MNSLNNHDRPGRSQRDESDFSTHKITLPREIEIESSKTNLVGYFIGVSVRLGDQPLSSSLWGGCLDCYCCCSEADDEDSAPTGFKLCHWAIGLRGLANMSNQWRCSESPVVP